MDNTLVQTNILIENRVILVQLILFHNMLGQYKQFATSVIACSLEYFLCCCFNYTTVVKVVKPSNADKPLQREPKLPAK